MNYGSPLPPPPPPTFGERLRRGLRFYGLIGFIIVLWAGSSLFIAPVVRWGLDIAGGLIERHVALSHEAYLLDLHLQIPCEALETLPIGCDGTEADGPVRYGPATVLYFWGALPDMAGLDYRRRELEQLPDSEWEGAFYTLQKSFGRLPVDDAALALARGEMAAYGAYGERTLPGGVLVIESAEGSAAKSGNFYAVYQRNDGLKIAAACFGTICKVLQAPWREGFAYGLTVNKRYAAELPAIDAAVRARLDGFVID